MIFRAGLLWTSNVAAAGQGHRYQGEPRHFSSYGLAAIYEPFAPSSVTLNGNDVSALASRVAGGIDVVQATGANQPLYVGAPTQYGQPSIQFTAANADRLQGNFNVIAANPATYVTVQKVRNLAADGFFFSNGNNTATTGWALGIRTSGPRRDSVATGVGARQDTSTLATSNIEIWVGRDWAAASPVTSLWLNNVNETISSAASVRLDPGATPRLTIGALVDGVLNSDVDFYFAAIFTSAVNDSAAYRMTKAKGAQFAIATS